MLASTLNRSDYSASSPMGKIIPYTYWTANWMHPRSCLQVAKKQTSAAVENWTLVVHLTALCLCLRWSDTKPECACVRGAVVSNGPIVLLWDDTWMSTKQWWNDVDSGKNETLWQNLTQCHFVHHKYDIDRPGSKLGFPWREAWHYLLNPPPPNHTLSTELTERQQNKREATCCGPFQMISQSIFICNVVCIVTVREKHVCTVVPLCSRYLCDVCMLLNTTKNYISLTPMF
jgi:hypothetical protein